MCCTGFTHDCARATWAYVLQTVRGAVRRLSKISHCAFELLLGLLHNRAGWWRCTSIRYRLVGLVVKASASRAEGPGFESHLRRDFSGSSHTSDLNIGTPVATLPGAWRYRVSTGTGRPGVSILWLGEVERLICNFYLSVAARKIVWADPSLRYTRMLLGR